MPLRLIRGNPTRITSWVFLLVELKRFDEAIRAMTVRSHCSQIMRSLHCARGSALSGSTMRRLPPTAFAAPRIYSRFCRGLDLALAGHCA